ncbi:sulfite exporter TauE/SafE family protein [Sporofaciens sp. SGI.106]|uniref:sulfite exporter TauE/SafE family protein n=1 Tax=Sporofaciens sp. SGI.106 TaxID=3420568 RepID=UPI003CFF3A64
MSIAKILVWVLIIWTAVFGVYYVKDVLKHKEDFKDVKYIPTIIIGVLANFFDTLGIGSYATSTTAFKFTKSCPDELIPGTLNVAYAIPVVVEAVVFIQKVTVDPLTLVLMIGSAILGAVIGASVVSKWDLKKVRIALGSALIALAIVMVCKLLGVGPFGIVGSATALTGVKLLIGVVANFVLGALMIVGLGLYAPCMALVLLLGMSADVAFPIMMGSCAFLMPSAGIKFVKEGKYNRASSLVLTVTGVIGVLIACFIITSLPLTVLTWIVTAVMIICAVIFFKDAAKA